MSGNRIQHESPSFIYSQTRNLPIETWQEIFWLASQIEDTDEFITDAGSYNRNIWDGRNVLNAEMASWDLGDALQMRRDITLVCKAWYAMGIEILYSHIRISSYLWGHSAALQRLVDNPRLSHAKRVTIQPYPHREYYVTWRASLWASLPRLQILDAPGGLFLPFPDQGRPSTLTVAIFRGQRNMPFELAAAPLPPYPLHGPWCNIRILKIDLHSVNLYTEPLRYGFGMTNFASVEELYLNEGHRRDEVMPTVGVESICGLLRFPKLHTLSICNFDWHDWWGFLEAHSQTLKTLSLTIYGKPYSPFRKKIEFPALGDFYLNCYEINHTMIAGNVTRVGWHGVGCDGDPAKATTEHDKSKSLSHLLLAFNYWHNFPTATTYIITGWHEVIEWLQEQPEVVEYLAKQEKYGVSVMFIQMKDKDPYARKSLYD